MSYVIQVVLSNARHPEYGQFKDELVRRNGKQRLGQLPDALSVEVLQILRGHDEVGVLFSDALQGVADILDDGGPHRHMGQQTSTYMFFRFFRLLFAHKNASLLMA